MLAHLFESVSRASPRLKQRLWSVWYDYLATRAAEDWVFMNFGFAAVDPHAPRLPLASSDEGNRLYIQLYHRVTAGVDLTGADVLEVGCGRGGGCLYLVQYRRARTVVGVDASRRMIAFCRQRHRAAGLAFVHGDAASLPFPDASFDAIVNIESSHCYGSMDRFLAEVGRVLRPSGHFLFADLRDTKGAACLRKQLRASGLALQTEDVISREVLHALTSDHERKVALIRQRVPRLLQGPVRQFAGVAGSRMYEALRSGRGEYLSCLLRKDSPGVPGRARA